MGRLAELAIAATFSTLAVALATACGHDEVTGMKNSKELTAFEESVIVDKATEPPGSGAFLHHFEDGVYTCKRCGAALYESKDKFDSGCGWPAFDDEIDGAVKRIPDPDGLRTEIVCAACGAHLGHVFEGEGLTPKDTRHCVNSISLEFEATADEQETGRAIFASGCFWGTEYFLSKAPGVLSTTVGYTGGDLREPTYEQVCTGLTGHAEAVKVVYDPSETSFEALARLFFETHDPTQVDGQGPDIGDQYRSGIFYLDEEQKRVARDLVRRLEENGLDVATEITPAGPFWPAEEYHQDYYDRKGSLPYCHRKVKRF